MNKIEEVKKDENSLIVFQILKYILSFIKKVKIYSIELK